MATDEDESATPHGNGMPGPKLKAEAPPGMRERPKAGMLTVPQYQDRLKRRFYRTLDYASIAFSMLVIYGSALLADYLLINLIEFLFRSELASSGALASFFQGVKIGLALLTFVLAIIHGGRSAWEQYKLEVRLIREDEKPHV